MRILIVTALLLLALVVGGLLAVSHLVDLAAYRDQLTARAETLTGQSVAIRGDIDLDLLPRPTLSLAQATLSDPADAVRLEVDRLDLQLRPLPLLGGRLDVAAVRLVRPVLQVAPEARAQLLDLLGGATWLPLAPDGPRRLSVVDGRAILPGTGGQSSELEQVNLDVSTAGASTAVELGGTFALNRQPLRIDARLGRPNEDRSGTLRLELAAEGLGGAGASSLTFGGVVRWRADAPRVRGEVVLSGADARSTIGTIGDALGRPAMAMPPWLATPFRLSGRLDLADDRLEVTDLTVGLDDAALTGRLGVVLAAVPEFNLRLQTQRLDLAGPSPQDLEAALGPLLALASAARGEIVLAAGALEHREAALRRVRATLRLGGDGGVTISEARALLPGDTDVGFAGALAGTRAGMELHGNLTAVTRNLRATLAFLDLEPAAVPEDRLNVLSLASEVALRRDGFRLREIDLRLDSTRVTGSVALQPAPRPQIAANLTLDRFDVDAYRPGRPPAEVLAGLAAPLRGVDAAIEAQIGRLTWGGVHLLDVAFGGRAVGERLRIDQLTVGDFADAEARVSGEVDLTDGAFDLTATLSDAHAPRVLRRFGVEPPPVLVRLDPLEVEASASGTLEAARIDVTVGAGSATLNLAGETGLSDGEPFYELEVAAGHPDYRALLQQLGARVPAAEDPAGPLEVAGRVQREAGGESSVAGTARLGGTSFTGRIAWQGEDRPYVDARISVGEPSAAVLGGLLEASGLRLEWPAADGAFRGRWSERPLALSLLEEFDGALVLSGKGGLAGEGIELKARLDEGVLTVEQLSLGLWDGRLEGELSFDLGRPLPYLVTTLQLENFDPGGLAAWLGVPPLLAGPASLQLETTAAGDNVRALVGSLIGEVELVAEDGVLAQALPEDFGASSQAPPTAADPAEVAASFALERGMLVVRPFEVALPGLKARVEGVIDLYLWALDLTLRRDDGTVLQLVGPLDRPQVRLSAAAGPVHASPAPSAAP